MPFLPDFVQINVGFSLPRNRSPGIYCGGEKGLLYLLFLLIFNRLKDQCSWYLFFSLSLRGYHYQTPKLTRDDLALIWIIKPSHNNCLRTNRSKYSVNPVIEKLSFSITGLTEYLQNFTHNHLKNNENFQKAKD